MVRKSSSLDLFPDVTSASMSAYDLHYQCLGYRSICLLQLCSALDRQRFCPPYLNLYLACMHDFFHAGRIRCVGAVRAPTSIGLSHLLTHPSLQANDPSAASTSSTIMMISRPGAWFLTLYASSQQRSKESQPIQNTFSFFILEIQSYAQSLVLDRSSPTSDRQVLLRILPDSISYTSMGTPPLCMCLDPE